MSSELKIDAVAVGTLIIVRDYPQGAFVGARHNLAKEISEKLSTQVSLFTETKNPGESDEDALGRLFKVEEAFISGISDRERLLGVKLSDSILVTRKGNASLATYLFEVDGEPTAKILDDEIAEIGLVSFRTVLDAPNGSWWLRWNVYEAIRDVMAWSKSPNNYISREHIQFRDRVPSGVYKLIDQGVSEIEALSRLGLHQPNEPLPWSFARLLSTPVSV